MTLTDVGAALNQAVARRRLLDHPYYRSWQNGLLTTADLAAYAGQYRHVERCLPEVLSATAGGLPDGAARHLVEANLADERSRPRSHVELFDRFAAAVGACQDARPTAATAATAQLTRTYRDAVCTGPAAALAVIGAYETQAGEIAATKAASLRDHYGLDSAGIEFWQAHAELEDTHAAWTVDALQHLDAEPAQVAEFAAASADAWWAFLDEQQAARQG